ncbi:sulfhydryl oxidase, partial [Favolaschia claudopus]
LHAFPPSGGRVPSLLLALLSLPPTLTNQLSTELYELIIDQVTDTPTLLACNLVSRSWAPRSRCQLLGGLACHSVPLIRPSEYGLGVVSCASDCLEGFIFGTTDGIYTSTHNLKEPTRLFPIHNASQLQQFTPPGRSFLTISLSALLPGSGSAALNLDYIARDITCFAVHSPRYRVCLLCTSSTTFSADLEVYYFDVLQDQNNVQTDSTAQAPAQVAFEYVMSLHTPYDTASLSFLSGTHIVATIPESLDAQHTFEVTDLVAINTRWLLKKGGGYNYPVHMKGCKRLVCYDKLAFSVDDRGKMARKEAVMRWDECADAFALNDSEPYLLAFCVTHIDVWNIDAGKKVWKIEGRYVLLNEIDARQDLGQLEKTREKWR